MIGWATITASWAAMATGLGSSLSPGIPPSAIDGFAAGMLLSGLCFLLAIARPHVSRRSKPRVRAPKHAAPSMTPTSRRLAVLTAQGAVAAGLPRPADQSGRLCS